MHSSFRKVYFRRRGAANVHYGMANKRRICYHVLMDEGRKRVLAIVAGILVARHLNTADDLFGGPQGSPRTDAMIAAAVQWAERS